MSTLYSWRKEAITLADALQSLAANDLTGFCMGPAHFRFAHSQGGQLQFSECLELEQVYEARFFNAELELRWLRDPARQGAGMAVCLAESPLDLDGWKKLDDLTAEPLADSTRPMTGTLGGEPDESTGWPLMDAPRHGQVAVPLTNNDPGKRPAYRVREYLGAAPGEAGVDGNRMVVEERIVGIVIAEMETKND